MDLPHPAQLRDDSDGDLLSAFRGFFGQRRLYRAALGFVRRDLRLLLKYFAAPVLDVFLTPLHGLKSQHTVPLSCGWLGKKVPSMLTNY